MPVLSTINKKYLVSLKTNIFKLLKFSDRLNVQYLRIFVYY